MLKIKKHKKKKGKKGTEDDLFDPANLESFKKELEAKKQREQQEQLEHPDQPTTASSSSAPTTCHQDQDKEEDDEWKKFKALTAGVDSIIQKSSGELERIKKSSVFQRKAPPPPSPPKPKPQIKPEETKEFYQHPKFEETKNNKDNKSELAPGVSSPDGVPVPEPEPPQDIELDDSLFDTTFVDAIESGEIKLNYIPDSPVEDPSGDDPFDTSALGDVIKKVEEEIKKKAKQINLGGVVEYLTGKSDKPAPPQEPIQLITAQPITKSSKRPRRIIPQNIDLLGGFDDDKQTEPSPVSNNQGESLEKKKGVDLNDLLREFDSIESKPEELSKLNPLDILANTVELGEHLGETLSTLGQGRKKSLAEELREDDPFDTSSVTVAGLGKSEIKKLEDELLSPAEEQQPHIPEQVQEIHEVEHKLKQEEKVKVSTEIPRVRPSPKVEERLREIHPLDSIDIAEGPAPSLSPTQPIEEKEQDPFDTSDYVVLPGKLELKFLEDELVDYTQLDHSHSPNPQSNIELFDPWGSEAQAAISNEPKFKIPAIPDDPFEVDPEVAAVAESTIPDDPFVVDTSIAAIAETDISAPLVSDPWDTDSVPVYTHAKALDPTPFSIPNNQVSPLEQHNEFEDPFDTTNIEDKTKVPHKLELKELESELLKSTTDFKPPVPTGHTWIQENLSKPPGRPQPIHHQESLLDQVDIHHEHAPSLLPTSSLYSTEEICEDPFDTSIAESIVPGKAELKLLEEHLDSFN